MAEITVLFEEAQGSPSEQWNNDGTFSGSRIFRVAWGDRHVFSKQMLGLTAGVWGIPESYPGIPSSLARSTSAQPWPRGIITNETTPNEYEQAMVTVNYEFLEPEDDGVLLEESIEPSAEFLSVGADKFAWDVAGAEPIALDETPGTIIRMMDWSLTQHRVLSPIPLELVSLMGNVNNQSFASRTLGLIFEAETLLYLGCSPSRHFTIDGPSAWTLPFKFTAKPSGWNTFRRSGFDAPQQMFKISDGTQYKPYPLADFQALFDLRVDV